MSGKRKKGPASFCWDSCVFIEWLCQEPGSRYAQYHRGMTQIVRQVGVGKARIIASSLVMVEVFEHRMPESAKRSFERIWDGQGFVEVEVNHRIASIAGEIRRQSSESRNMDTISVPDAVHMATAFVHNARALHTLENFLLSLDGKVFTSSNYRAKICLPAMPQTTLDLD